MQDIVLNLDPSTWNVLKFIILTIITTPLLEFLLQRFINTKATYDVMRGEHVQFAESNLGVLSLHSVYWGRRRNSIYLLLVASLVFASELIFEFSFSAQALDIAEPREVWLPPSHAEHYTFSGRSLDGPERREPFQFPVLAAETCIKGESEMRRTGRSNEADGEFISGFEYHMEDTYVIRKPYLALDNSSVLCSVSTTIGRVSFFVPHVYLVNSSTGAEGVLALKNTSNSENVRQSLTSGTFDSYGFVNDVQVVASDNAVCIRSRSRSKTFLCAMYVMNAFILARTSEIWSDRVPDKTLLSVVLNATGQPVEGMRSRTRKLRYLATVSGNALLNTFVEGRRPSHQLVTKDKTETLALLVLVVANEEGVGGSRNKIGKRSFVIGQAQTATMKRLAFVPIAILVSFLVFLLVVEVTLSKLIASSTKNQGRKIWGCTRAGSRADTSIQWLRERICEDLLHDGVFRNISSKELSLKIVSGELQMLPKVPTEA